jgi:hypothetical protein
MLETIPESVSGKFRSSNEEYLQKLKHFYPKSRIIKLEGLSGDVEAIHADVKNISSDYRLAYLKKKAEVLMDEDNG